MSETEATPIIPMTPEAQQHKVANYIVLGVTGVIIKPFDPLSSSTEIALMTKISEHS